MDNRRKHSKIKELPEEMISAVNDLIARGKTYEQITGFLKSNGHEIGKSSVGRYAQDFTARMERIQLVSDKMEPFMAKMAEKPNMNMAAMATQMGLMELIEFIESGEIENEKSKANAIAAICDAASRIQRSQAQAEKLRLEWTEKAEKAMKKLERLEGGDKLSASSLKQIREILDLKV
jgi:hypothetical protein